MEGGPRSERAEPEEAGRRGHDGAQEAGSGKIDLTTGLPRMNRCDKPRLKNRKTKVDYDDPNL